MTDIMISFAKYIPKPKIFYGYFEIMKSLNFIEDVMVLEDEKGDPVIKIIRNKPEDYSKKDDLKEVTYEKGFESEIKNDSINSDYKIGSKKDDLKDIMCERNLESELKDDDKKDSDSEKEEDSEENESNYDSEMFG